jgi:hypothetical protein
VQFSSNSQKSNDQKPGVKVKTTQVKEPDFGQARLNAVFGGAVILPKAAMPNRQLLFRGRNAEHLWCRCCARAFPNGIYRQEGNVRRCPYSDCAGHATVDALEWERVRGTNAGYPQAPLLGTRYPLGPPPPLASQAGLAR